MALNRENATINMEAHLLLAKLYYLAERFDKALNNIESSMIDKAKTQFVTLRSLKLAAEGYAIKGFTIQRQSQASTPPTAEAAQQQKKRMMSCFDAAVQLGLSYIAEYEKSAHSSTSRTLLVA